MILEETNSFGVVKFVLGPLATNCYLIYDKPSGKGILIDPGAYDPEVSEYIKDNGITVVNILNTHGHADHITGDSAFGFPVLIHELDEPCLGNPLKNLSILSGGNISLVKASGVLNGGDIIELGDKYQLRVIHLPGHSSGSVGFYWEEEGILFTGDALQGLGKDTGGLPIVEDLAAYEGSLERLQQLPVKLMLHAHDFRGVKLPSTPMKRSDEVRQFVRDCQEFTKRIGEVVRHIAPHASGKPIMDVYDEVVDKLPKEMGFKPASQVPKPFFAAMTVYSSLIQAGQ